MKVCCILVVILFCIGKRSLEEIISTQNLHFILLLSISKRVCVLRNFRNSSEPKTEGQN